jgi:hypothetical protein
MSAYRNLVDGFLHLLGVNVERQGLPGVEQTASARGLFDQLLERQLQQQRKRDYGLPSNARDLGADF